MNSLDNQSKEKFCHLKIEIMFTRHPYIEEGLSSQN